MFRKQKNKIRLTRQEEFEILKLILDKFLWLGTIGLGVGLFLLLNTNYDNQLGLLITLIGALILMLFTAILAKEIHIQRGF